MQSAIAQKLSNHRPSSGAWLWIITLLPVSAIALLWWRVHGVPWTYALNGAPAGQGLYVLSKLAVLLAIVIVGIQICLGLLRKTHALPPLTTPAARWHGLIGTVAIALALSHVSLFIVAVSIRNGAPAWGLLVPRPFAGYYDLGLALGLIGFAVIAAVSIAGTALPRRSTWARWTHRLALPGYLLLLVHAWAIGSESRVIYTVLVLSVVLMSIAIVLLARLRMRSLDVRASRSYE